MMKYVPFIAFVLIVLILSGGLRSQATAGAQVAANGNLAVRSSGLLVKIKHKKQQNKNNDGNDDQSSSGNQDDATPLECTIQKPGESGGCLVGFKRVCEKLKNGNKCCGCVVDKNAKDKTQTSPTQPTTPLFDCEAEVEPAPNRYHMVIEAASAGDALAKAKQQASANYQLRNDSVTCNPRQ